MHRKLNLTLSVSMICTIALGILALATPVLAGDLIGSVFPISDNNTWNETSCALAYNTVREEYLAVWFNDGVSDDIFAQRLDRDGRKLGVPFPISAGDGHVREYPDVAYNSQVDEYLVVWEDRDNTTWKSIQSRRVSGAGSVLDPVDILISNYSASSDSYRPAVAYSSSSDRYMVVWVEWQKSPVKYSLYARKITQQGNYDGAMFLVSQSGANHNYPDIAYNPVTDRHLVVWQEYSNADSVTNIRGCQVYGSGGVCSSPFPVESRPNNATSPSVAAIGSAPGDARFLVVYDYEFLLTDHDIYGVLIESNGAIASDIFPGTSYNTERFPAVAGSENGKTFLILWREEVGLHDNRIKACLYDTSGNMLGSFYEFNGVAANMGSASAGPRGDFLAGWQDQPYGQDNRDLFGALFGTRSYAPLISH